MWATKLFEIARKNENVSNKINYIRITLIYDPVQIHFKSQGLKH